LLDSLLQEKIGGETLHHREGDHILVLVFDQDD